MIDTAERISILFLSVDGDMPPDLMPAVEALPDVHVFKAMTPEQGISFLSSHNVAVVIISFGYKENAAVNAARKMISSLNHRTVPLLFIGATRLSRRYDENEYDTGIVDFLSLPLEKDFLLGKVKFFIDYHKKNKQLEFFSAELEKLQDRVTKEIRNRKNVEISLGVSRQQFKSLSENSPDIIFILAFDGAFFDVNPAWEKILGHAKEDIIGRYFIEFVQKEDAPYFKHLFKQVRDERKILSDITGTLCHKDGTTRIFSFSGTPSIGRDGKVQGMIGLLKDVTQQHKLQYQLQHAQKMEAIGTLAGGVAHDFNNLLQAIHGYADLLIYEDGKDTPGYEEITEIKHIAQRGAELTQQLLTFSRKVKSKLKPVDINMEIDQVKKLLERTIPKMIDIELHLAEDIPVINADPAQIEQVIMNLGVNARDAMPDGGKLMIKTAFVSLSSVFCSTCPGLSPGNYILITVTDTGIGMDVDIQEHIFEPFFTTKKVGKGTGLGLSIIYGIIKNHGGCIFCETAPSKGTSFKIYLPVPDQPTVVENIDQMSETASSNGTETVMLVDDDPYVRAVGEKMLKRSGYKILTAPNGESALDLYRKKHHEIDLVILDLIMPGMGGKNCLEEIFKIKPLEKVIITTGYSFDNAEKDDIFSKAKGFIDKPYESRDLLQRARHVLDQS